MIKILNLVVEETFLSETLLKESMGYLDEMKLIKDFNSSAVGFSSTMCLLVKSILFSSNHFLALTHVEHLG